VVHNAVRILDTGGRKPMITLEQIRRNGGCYDTKKYRYIIDTTTWEIKRTLITNLGTTTMLDKNAWETVKTEKGERK